MNKKSKSNGVMNISANQKKNTWIQIAGAVALLTIGIVLYKKRQTKLGSALMTGSMNILTAAVPQL